MEIIKTRNLKILTLLVAVLFSLSSFAQREETHLLSPDDPICANWEFIDDAGNAPILAGAKQSFISIKAGLTRSSMGTRNLSNSALICPTYFNLSKDDNHFYFQILDESCNDNLSEEDKFITVEYNLGKVKKVNTIEINGSKHEIEEMKTILTLTIDGVNYHYAIVEQ